MIGIGRRVDSFLIYLCLDHFYSSRRLPNLPSGVYKTGANKFSSSAWAYFAPGDLEGTR